MGSLFRQRVKDHLACYKQQELGIQEDGVWKGNSKPYPHILPSRSFEQNILPLIQSLFWSSPLSKVKLHKDFHHLNSSQALCFNHFFPYLQNQEKLAVLVCALGFDETPGIGAQFEYSPDPLEGTSVDFVLTLTSGARILFEIKYTEADFGKATDDLRHQQKFKAVYFSRLKSRFTEKFCERSVFFAHYQMFRNILHLREDHSDVVIFLVPRANENLRTGLEVLKHCTTELYAQRVRVIFLEELVTKLDKTSPADIREVLRQFRRKYLI